MTDGRFLKKDQLTEEKISQIRALNEMAGQRGEKLSQMALKWVMKDPVVTSVLIGASKPEQILDNLKMLDGAPLSEEELLKNRSNLWNKINRKRPAAQLCVPAGRFRPCWQTISI